MDDFLDDDKFPVSFAFVSKQIASKAINSAVKAKVHNSNNFLDITTVVLYYIQDRTSPPVTNAVVSSIHSAIKKSIENYYTKV